MRRKLQNTVSSSRFLRNGGSRMGTVIVLLILAGIVALIIRSMVKDKKAGKSIQCGGDCKNCGGHCH
jgi:hypothetical protein